MTSIIPGLLFNKCNHYLMCNCFCNQLPMDACASAQSNLTTCNAKSKRETIIKKNNQTFKNHLHFTSGKLI